MALNFFNIQFITSSLVLILIAYIILLMLDANNYLKILVIFEVILLMITLIFVININESVDHIVLLTIVLIGGESCLALSIIFPFILK